MAVTSGSEQIEYTLQCVPGRRRGDGWWVDVVGLDRAGFHAIDQAAIVDDATAHIADVIGVDPHRVRVAQLITYRRSGSSTCLAL